MIREHIDALNRGDRERYLATLAGDAILKLQGAPSLERGGEAVPACAWALRALFANLHAEIVSIYVRGDHGVVSVRWSGTHQHDLTTRTGTIPASGQQVTYPGHIVFRVRGGKLTFVSTYLHPSAALA